MQPSRSDEKCHRLVSRRQAQTDGDGERERDLRFQSSYYSALDSLAEYCNERVCVCVCLSVRDHISGTTRPSFITISARYLSLHVARSDVTESVVTIQSTFLGIT